MLGCCSFFLYTCVYSLDIIFAHIFSTTLLLTPFMNFLDRVSLLCLSWLGLLLLWWNTMTKSNVGRRERVYLDYTSTSLFIIEGSQDRESNRAGAQRQELMQSPWKVLLAGLLPKTFSACFLIESRTTSQGMAPPTMSWALTHQSLIKKMPSSLPTAM